MPLYNDLTRQISDKWAERLLPGQSQDVPLRRMFTWTAVTGSALGLTQILLVTGTCASSLRNTPGRTAPQIRLSRSTLCCPESAFHASM